jgi:hypothetical protein
MNRIYRIKTSYSWLIPILSILLILSKNLNNPLHQLGANTA